MEKARYNTELYSNLSEPLNNVKPSNFLGSHQIGERSFYLTSNNFISKINVEKALIAPAGREP